MTNERGFPEVLDWNELRRAVCVAGNFQDNPDPQYWLSSDAGPSFCWKCAIKAREDEFGLGPLIDPDKPSYRNTDLEEVFFHGIDGGSWYSAIEDSTAHCSSCGKMLHYWLTDYGIDEELSYFEDSEFSNNLSDIAYELDRLFELTDDDPRRESVRFLAEKFLSHASAVCEANNQAGAS